MAMRKNQKKMKKVKLEDFCNFQTGVRQLDVGSIPAEDVEISKEDLFKGFALWRSSKLEEPDEKDFTQGPDVGEREVIGRSMFGQNITAEPKPEDGIAEQKFGRSMFGQNISTEPEEKITEQKFGRSMFGQNISAEPEEKIAKQKFGRSMFGQNIPTESEEKFAKQKFGRSMFGQEKK
jgi:hypothetical protein